MSQDTFIDIVVKSPKERKDISISSSSSTKELKEICSREFSTAVDQLCVIFSGKILSDVDVLKTVGVRDGSTLHLVIKSAHRLDDNLDHSEQRLLPGVPMADISVTPFGLGSLGGISGLSGLGMGSANFMDLQQRMMQEMVNNPDMLKSLLDSPFVKQMMSNPDMMRQLMETNPQLREVMERNPEIIQTMADPDLMRRMIEVVRSPAMLQELMRGQEHLVGVVRSTASSSTGLSPSKKDQLQAKATPAPVSVSELYGDAGTRSMLQQLAHNPEVMTNMMQAPYVQSMLQAMSANPQLIQQMLTNSPLFANSSHLQESLASAMPYFSQQLMNPEVQNIMSNQRALQGLLLIQQGMQELNAEVPNMFSPSSTESASSDADPYTQYMSYMLNMVSGTASSTETPYALQLQQLALMGFNDKDTNLEVLSACQGDVNACINRLLQKS